MATTTRLIVAQVVQRLQRHDELRGRAVRVGDDVLLGEADDGVGVHLRHDQRHVLVVAPGGRVIDDDAALGGDLRRPFLGDRRRRPTSGRCRCRRSRSSRGPCILSVASPKETSVPRLRREASATTSSAGKSALGEDVQHFAAHIARGADDGDLVTHVLSSCSIGRAGRHRRGVALPPRRKPGKSSLSIDPHLVW